MSTVYDYVIVGSGWGGLTQAALHARDGKRVCVLEASDRAGGFTQSFGGNGYSFTPGIFYLQGCQPGWKVHQFLEMIGLEDEIRFNRMNPDGYDKISVAGDEFTVPLGVDNFAQKLVERFPDERSKIRRYFRIMRRISDESEAFQRVYSIPRLLRHPWRNRHWLRWALLTLQDVFDRLKLSPQLRAILGTQASILALTPDDAAIAAQSYIVIGYGAGAFYPKRGMAHLVERLVRYIRDRGGAVHFNARVKELRMRDHNLSVAVTDDGRRWHAQRFVSNLDPKLTFKLLNGYHVGPWIRQYMDYKYSVSSFLIFLGLKNIDLTRHGFGPWSTWHWPTRDIGQELKEVFETRTYKDPFVGMVTPSLCTDPGVLAPPDCATMQLVCCADFDYFQQTRRSGNRVYENEVERVTDEILSYVEATFVPQLRRHIDYQEVWSPLDIRERIGTPRGNIYGAELSPHNFAFHRVSRRTPIKNLFLVGATSCYPGLLGVTTGSLQLYERLKQADTEDGATFAAESCGTGGPACPAEEGP